MTLNKKLLLVTGCPRSGTTIANIVLNSHPNISITNECNLINILEKIESSSIFSRFRSINSKDLKREMSTRENYKINDLKRFVPGFDSSIDSLLFSFCSSIKIIQKKIKYLFLEINIHVYIVKIFQDLNLKLDQKFIF